MLLDGAVMKISGKRIKCPLGHCSEDGLPSPEKVKEGPAFAGGAKSQMNRPIVFSVDARDIAANLAARGIKLQLGALTHDPAAQ